MSPKYGVLPKATRSDQKARSASDLLTEPLRFGVDVVLRSDLVYDLNFRYIETYIFAVGEIILVFRNQEDQYSPPKVHVDDVFGS
jgi:hypothetical protein